MRLSLSTSTVDKPVGLCTHAVEDLRATDRHIRRFGQDFQKCEFGRGERSGSPFIADFMGEANVLPCEVIQSDAGEVLVRVSNLEHRLQSKAAQGPAKLAVRPGAIRIGAPHAAGLRGRVLHSAYLGGHVEYEVETDVGTLFVIDHDVDHAHAAASDVTLAFKNRGIAVISG